MSWKSIEMQVALPRTQDAGKLQEQMLKQNQHFQESLAQSQLKDIEQKRKRVQEFESINDVKIKDEDEQGVNNSEEQKAKSEYDEFAEHPYLGKKIDFSG
ncbi:hypothetical protein SAMN05216232_2738 [Virgibacillus subterraneus]|uniref:Uncharacterized protein n=2 Tax=Virgibacillus TaxID=84406 RepID=A0A1H1C794_9BACI|nr:hypothetical protein SAMN05216231_2110 [Virgibacillus salinus]SEQ57503.1 hypothetical protein SAMN05216232_2738 [Virgibacillus subterraneus]